MVTKYFVENFKILIVYLLYLFLLTACGGVLSNPQGILMSPGFPARYTNNLRCNYSVIMDPEHYTLLSFDADNFDIECK